MTDYSLFFGAFHPVVVHLPIGVLLVAFAFQLLSFVPRLRSLSVAVPWLYGFAALGGVVAVVTGWLLAGPLGETAWDTHRWFGLGALGLVTATTLSVALTKAPALLNLALGAAAVGVTAWAGHLGGNLVHGSEHFAQYAPAGVAVLVGGQSSEALQASRAEARVVNPDSLLAYPALIAPMLTEHCVDCHRADFARGGLRLDSYAALVAGGREGGGLSTHAELWRRVALPPDHPRYMPTRGEPLSYDELTILRAWLGAGPDSTATITQFADHLDDETYDAIERSYRVNVRPLPYIERARPQPIEIASDLTYWNITPLSQRHTTLVANLRQRDAPQDEALAELERYASNVTLLDMSGISDADQWIERLPELPHLTKFDLTGSDATDATLEKLSDYKHLATLKLTGTKVSDQGLPSIKEMDGLRQVYLFDTRVSDEALGRLEESAGDQLEVVGRIQLASLAADE